MFWHLSSWQWCTAVDMPLRQCWQDQFRANLLSLTNMQSGSLILIRNTPITARTRWCYTALLIFQLPHYPPVVKSLPVALSSRKCSIMSNGVREIMWGRAGSKSQFRSSHHPLVHLGSWQTDDTVRGPGCISVPGSSIAPGVISGSVLVRLVWRIHSQSRSGATVQRPPVEDSRAITKLKVTSVSPEVMKEIPTLGPKGLLPLLAL